MLWHMKRGLILEDRWVAEIDQRLGELLSQQTCQGTGSSSWSQATGRVETFSAKPPCLSGFSPWCLSYRAPAKVLVVVCIQNVHVMLIEFVRRRVERLRRCKPQICKERIHFSIPLPRFDFVDSLTVQNGLCIARIADMTLIVLVCCVHSPLVPGAVISTGRDSLHVKTCARTYIWGTQAHP